MPREFIASMELYKDGADTIAIIRQPGNDGEPQEVIVPPHMAMMLPQAMAMISAENGS